MLAKNGIILPNTVDTVFNVETADKCWIAADW